MNLYGYDNPAILWSEKPLTSTPTVGKADLVILDQQEFESFCPLQRDMDPAALIFTPADRSKRQQDAINFEKALSDLEPQIQCYVVQPPRVNAILLFSNNIHETVAYIADTLDASTAFDDYWFDLNSILMGKKGDLDKVPLRITSMPARIRKS